jgi:hypothetical protein
MNGQMRDMVTGYQMGTGQALRQKRHQLHATETDLT